MIRRRLAGLCGLLAACLIVAASPGSAADTAGKVTRAQGETFAKAQDGNRRLAAGGIVASDDTLVTLDDSRLAVRLVDGAELTLGANANLRINNLVFNQADATRSRLALFADGAFRMITGKINSTTGASVQVSSPVATLAVRGTDFWTGPIDGIYGVLLLSGEVNVRTAGGEVTLNEPGTGTNITDAASPPGPVGAWAPDKVSRALAAVAFR
ncbi:MAG: hypothetical protein HKN11_21385 [Rhizobiales bacterium]|nr:hypothetical protein [Hyphomicrobiales bacterium]